MYALYWKKAPPGWPTTWHAVGTNNKTYAFAASKEELDLKLATIGYELGCMDSDGTDDSFDVWNVRKFPGNSLEKDRRQC